MTAGHLLHNCGSSRYLHISLDTECYELLKGMLPKHMSSCDLKLLVENEADKSGAIVNIVLTDDREGLECFT